MTDRSPPEVPGGRAGPRILAVDDDDGMLRAYPRLLRGFHVIALPSGSHALDWLSRGEHFDAFVCDMMMPEMSGAVLHSRLRAFVPLLARRTIFVTGGGTSAAEVAFLETTTQPVLMKPIRREQLVAALDGVLRSP